MTPNYQHTRYACYLGSFVQAITNNLLPILFIILRSDFGLTYEKLGGLILLNFVTQLIVDILAVKFVDKVGYRIPLVLAHALSCLGLCLLAASPLLPIPMYGALIVSVVVYAIGGGLLEVLVSPVVDSLPAPQEQKGAKMALLHSFYCWGQVTVVAVSTLLLLGMSSSRWQLLPLVWALVPLCNVFLFSRVPLVPALHQDERMRMREMFTTPVFLAAMALMIASGASELTVSQWASLFAEQGLGLSKVWGDLAGPCLFALLMGLGRLVYGIWGAKIHLVRFMALSAALCVVCYLLISLSPHPAVSLIACGVCGFSVSIMWPGAISLSAARFPMGGTAMFAILAMAGDIGCSVGPWLAGITAEQSTVSGSLLQKMGGVLFSGGGEELKMGILFGTIFPVILLLALPAFRTSKLKKAAEAEES